MQDNLFWKIQRFAKKYQWQLRFVLMLLLMYFTVDDFFKGNVIAVISSIIFVVGYLGFMYYGGFDGWRDE